MKQRDDTSWDKLLFSDKLKAIKVAETTGTCRVCKKPDMLLGEGLCVACWDYAMDYNTFKFER
jgi:hypothetical protein